MNRFFFPLLFFLAFVGIYYTFGKKKVLKKSAAIPSSTGAVSNPKINTNNPSTNTLPNNNAGVVTPSKIQVPVFIFAGESGAASKNSNDTASQGDFDPVSNVRIVNNNTLNLEPINFPNNNCLNENDTANGSAFGWEVPACNLFKIGGIGNYSELIIIKTAQPGAVIGQYNEDIRNGYFTATMNKINVVKNALANEGKTPKFYIFYSQGINNQRYSDLSDDAHFPNLRGSEYWLAATRVYLNKLVANTSNDTKVCVSKFWDEYGDYVNGRIDQLTNDNPTHFSSVNTANLSRQGDRLHLDTPSNKSLFLQMYYKMS